MSCAQISYNSIDALIEGIFYDDREYTGGECFIQTMCLTLKHIGVLERCDLDRYLDPKEGYQEKIGKAVLRLNAEALQHRYEDTGDEVFTYAEAYKYLPKDQTTKHDRIGSTAMILEIEKRYNRLQLIDLIKNMDFCLYQMDEGKVPKKETL